MLLKKEAASNKVFSNGCAYAISFVLASGRDVYYQLMLWAASSPFLAFIFVCVGGMESLRSCRLCVCVCVHSSSYTTQKPSVRGVPNSPLLFTILFPALLQSSYNLSLLLPFLVQTTSAAAVYPQRCLCVQLLMCLFSSTSLSVSFRVMSLSTHPPVLYHICS